MKKRGIFSLILLESLFLINIVKALEIGSFSLSNLTNDTLSLISTALIFIIFFALINYAVAKKLPTAISAIISFCLSALIIFGTLKAGLDIPSYFRESLFSIGINESIFYIIVAVVFILVLIQLIRKLGLGKLLFIIGLILVGLVLFTELIYSKGATSIIAIFFLIIGAWFWRRKHTSEKRFNRREAYKQEAEKERAKRENEWNKNKRTKKEIKRNQRKEKWKDKSKKTGETMKNIFNKRKKELFKKRTTNPSQKKSKEFTSDSFEKFKAKEKLIKKAKKDSQNLIEDKKWRNQK